MTTPESTPQQTGARKRCGAALIPAISLSLLVAACGGGGGGAATSTQSWGTAQLLETIDLGDGAENARVAMNAQGHAVVVWEQQNFGSSTMSVYARYYHAANGWGAVTALENLSGTAINPAVAIDGNGRAFAVWEQSDGVRTNIWRASYDPANNGGLGGWGSAGLLETDDLGDAERPAIAMDATGRTTVAWRQNDGGAYLNVKARRYTPGSGWDAVTLIELEDLGNVGAPVVSMSSSGSAMVTWRQNDGATWNVWAARYDIGPGWDATVKVDDATVDVQSPHVAHDTAGNVLVTWTQAHSVTNKLVMVGKMYRPGTGWSGASTLGQSADQNAYSQRVAAWGTEKFGVFWYQDNAGTTDAYWTRIDGGLQPAKLLENDNTGSAYDPQGAFLSDGSGVATWLQNDGTRNNIWAVNLIAGGTSGTPQLLETDNTGHARSPQLAMAADGKAIVVWTQTDGTRYNVWYNMRQ